MLYKINDVYVIIIEVQKVFLLYIYGVWKCCNIVVDRCIFIVKIIVRKKCYESMDFICKCIFYYFNVCNLYILCYFKCCIFIRKLILIYVSIVFMLEKFIIFFLCLCSVFVYFIWLLLDCIYLMDFMQKINIFKNQVIE